MYLIIMLVLLVRVIVIMFCLGLYLIEDGYNFVATVFVVTFLEIFLILSFLCKTIRISVHKLVFIKMKSIYGQDYLKCSKFREQGLYNVNEIRTIGLAMRFLFKSKKKCMEAKEKRGAK